ncbi:hypothetical protein EV368DRAFT_79732 [Lentinula lateritia]|nr:hypothetical protein EV368DRAFT_79732 [Lentinula lateritia]
MGRRKLSELSNNEDDEVNTQSEDVYYDGRNSQGEEDEDEDVNPGELDIDADNDLNMEDWPRPPARTAQKQTVRLALASVNQNPVPRITRQTKKTKMQQDTVSTTEIQRLKEKTMQLRKQLAIAKGKSRKARENPISAEEFEGPESEEDTQMMYSTVATPLPSMSTPKAPQINLNRLLSTRKVSGKKPASRNTFQNVIIPSDVTLSPTSENSSTLVSGSSAPTTSASSRFTTSITTTIDTNTGSDITGSQAGSSDTQMNITPELSAALPLRANWQPGARAKTADYTAEGEAILLRAMRDFEARIVGQDFFPDQTTRLQWAEKCFRDACATAKAQFISDKRVLKLDRKAWTGYAEHPSIIFLLSYIFDESNMGMVFKKYFNLISLQTLASLFTMIRAAILEWSSGTCNKIKKFSEEEYDKYYKAYLIDLTKWDGMNPAVSLNIRHRMYAKSRMHEESLDDSTVHIFGSIEAQLHQEMEARTGDTESEPEDSEIDDDNDEDDCGGGIEA